MFLMIILYPNTLVFFWRLAEKGGTLVWLEAGVYIGKRSVGNPGSWNVMHIHIRGFLNIYSTLLRSTSASS
jgi:hypothetical protein